MAPIHSFLGRLSVGQSIILRSIVPLTNRFFTIFTLLMLFYIGSIGGFGSRDCWASPGLNETVVEQSHPESGFSQMNPLNDRINSNENQTHWLENQTHSAKKQPTQIEEPVHEFEGEAFLSQCMTLLQGMTTIGSERVFLFVPGFGQEAAQIFARYFGVARSIIQKFFRARAENINLSSKNSKEKNASILYEKIKAYFQKYKKPIILFGHSKGGAEILYMIWKYPEVMTSFMIDRVVLVQAAIFGTELAIPFHPEASWSRQFFRNAAPYIGVKGGLESLEPQLAKTNATWLHAQFKESVSQQTYEDISNRVFYLRSCKSTDETSWATYLGRLATVGRIPLKQETCQNQACLNHPNQCRAHDGYIRVQDQIFPGFGRDLGIIKADHAHVVIDSWLGGWKEPFQLQIWNQLIRSILSEDPIQTFSNWKNSPQETIRSRL